MIEVSYYEISISKVKVKSGSRIFHDTSICYTTKNMLRGSLGVYNKQDIANWLKNLEWSISSVKHSDSSQ